MDETLFIHDIKVLDCCISEGRVEKAQVHLCVNVGAILIHPAIGNDCRLMWLVQCGADFQMYTGSRRKDYAGIAAAREEKLDVFQSSVSGLCVLEVDAILVENDDLVEALPGRRGHHVGRKRILGIQNRHDGGISSIDSLKDTVVEANPGDGFHQGRERCVDLIGCTLDPVVTHTPPLGKDLAVHVVKKQRKRGYTYKDEDSENGCQQSSLERFEKLASCHDLHYKGQKTATQQDFAKTHNTVQNFTNFLLLFSFSLSLKRGRIEVKQNKRRNKMKKLATVFLVALIAMTSSFASGSAEASSDGITTLTFAAWDMSQSLYIYEVIEAFEAANPDIRIEVQDTPSADYVTRLNTQLNGGSTVDLFLIKEADKSKTFYDRGQLTNLSPYIEAAGIDMSAYNGTETNFIFDGNIYAMPTRTDQYVLFYNKDIFDAAGVPYPDNDMTWTEFEELAARLTSGEGANKKYGAFFHSWNACVQNWGVQDGVHTIMSGEYSFFKPYYEMVLRMQEAGTCMSFAQIQASGLHYADVFAQGNVAMLPMGSWFISTMIQRNQSGESSVNWGVAVVPHAEDVPNGYTVGSTTPICINNASRHKDEAWKFVEFLTGPEGARIYASAGQTPALGGEEYLEIFASSEGMPDGIVEGMHAVNIAPDRPAMDKVSEVDQMLLAEHQLILLGEETVDEGIANMNRNFQEIMSN